MKKRVLKIAALLMAAVGFAPQAQADTDLLTAEKGYTKITQMPADEKLDDYYFVIVDKNNDLMISLENDGNKKWYYRKSVEPALYLNADKLWTIEKGTKENSYSFRSVAEPTYLMETNTNAGWDFFLKTSTTPNDNTSFTFAYADNCWTFESVLPDQNNGFIGPWDENDFTDGANTAANKSTDNRGYFVLYSIPKTALQTQYTEVTQMPVENDLANYYFIIKDNRRDLMVALENNTWYYRTSADPVTNRNIVWTIEKGTKDNSYSFRCAAEPTYLMETEQSAGWNFFLKTSTTPNDNTSFTFAYADNSWTFESAVNATQYIGPWDANIFSDGQKTAANKPTGERGYFTLYSIPKANLDNIVLPQTKDKALAEIADYEAILNNSTAESKVITVYTTAINTAKSDVNNATDTEAVDAAMAALETARQTYVLAATPNSGYSFDYTFLIAGACDSNNGWTKTYGPVVSGSQDNYGIKNSTDKNNGELTSKTYLETWTPATVGDNQQPNMYGAGQLYYTATNLPAGHYKISAYTFDGNKSGVVDFFVNDQKKTLDATTDLFTLSSISDVAIAPYKTLIGLEIKEAGKTQWVGITNIKLEYLSPLTAADLELAKAQYEKVLAEAEGMDITTNVGENAFQIPTQAATNLTTGITLVKQTYGNGDDIDKVVEATENLAGLMEDYRNATLNAPADGQVFNIEITTPDNWKFKNLPLTLHAGGASFYPGRDASCYAQTLMLKQAEGNLYTISTVFADGKEYYLCTAQTIGTGNTNQIRTTDDAAKALLIEVIPTDVQGVYNLRNTESNGLLGCQDGDDKASGGLYGTSSHPTFTITETDMPSVTLTTAAEWATLILPFNAEIPDGLEVYSCAGTDTEGEDATLTLEAVETIAANTPYIVKAAANFTHTFEGFGAAETTTYTAGMLTGTFAEMEAVEGTYVLQNQAEKGVGFYKVETEKPVVKANRAYLNAEAAPAGSNVQAFILKSIDGDGTTTGIDGTVAEADATVNVYNLNGILVRENVKMGEALNGLQKGIYIVNGTKKAVK